MKAGMVLGLFASVIILTTLVTPVKAELLLPTGYCLPHYECREWRWVQWGCDCDGNPCYFWYREWAKKYYIDRNCNETLVGSCTYKGCIHDWTMCCPPPKPPARGEELRKYTCALMSTSNEFALWRLSRIQAANDEVSR